MIPKSTAPRDDDAIRRKGSRTGTSLFGLTLLGMIVAGLGGYGVTNFGTHLDTAIKVGAQEISANDYARALQNRIRQVSQQFGTQLTLQQAQMFGIDQQVLQSLVAEAALSNEALRLGVMAPDLAVAKAIGETKAFQDINGKFDKTTYQAVLEQNNLKTAAYEKAIRDDLTRQILQIAITNGQVPNEALLRALYAHQAETRSFTLLLLTEASLPAPLPAPTEEALKAYYDAHIADFTRPEGKRLSYARLAPADLAKDQTVAEADVKAAYDAAADSYNIPEKRLVERLVYPSAEEAKAARAALDGGQGFEDLVKARGLDLATVDLGDVTRIDLAQAADPVFAAKQGDVVGPVETDLGPAFFRINGVIEAQATPYEEAAPKIRQDLATQAATRAIATRTEAVDDLLAGGASIEEVAKEQGMTAATTDFAPGAEDNDPVTADAAFAKAVGAMEPGDFAQSLILEDGSLVVVQVAEALPATPIPLDKAKAKVEAALKAEELNKALTALAATYAKDGSRLEAHGITTKIPAATRSAPPQGVPAAALALAFAAKPGDVVELNADGTVGLVRLDGVTAADLNSDAAKAGMAQLAAQLSQSLASDAYDISANALTTQGGLTIDQAVITSVQSQM
jgi:peptidyl-prolyl cis-trans isomerase D